MGNTDLAVDFGIILHFCILCWLKHGPYIRRYTFLSIICNLPSSIFLSDLHCDAYLHDYWPYNCCYLVVQWNGDLKMAIKNQQMYSCHLKENKKSVKKYFYMRTVFKSTVSYAPTLCIGTSIFLLDNCRFLLDDHLSVLRLLFQNTRTALIYNLIILRQYFLVLKMLTFKLVRLDQLLNKYRYLKFSTMVELRLDGIL